MKKMVAEQEKNQKNCIACKLMWLIVLFLFLWWAGKRILEFLGWLIK